MCLATFLLSTACAPLPPEQHYFEGNLSEFEEMTKSIKFTVDGA